jgi:hypothetical protein
MEGHDRQFSAAPPEPHRTRRAIAALIVAVLALGGVGFLLWRSENRVNDLKAQFDRLDSSIDSVESTLGSDLQDLFAYACAGAPLSRRDGACWSSEREALAPPRAAHHPQV